LSQLSKGAVLASLAGAIAFESWQGRFAYPYLPTLAGLAALIGIAGVRLIPQRIAAAVLVFAYWVPVVFVALTHRPFLPPFFVIWSAALAGLIVGDPDALEWSYPSRFRAALILWALSVALGWPIVAYREADFQSLALLERYHVSNTGIGGSPTLMVAWMSDVAILHLLGLMWFDWLCRRDTDVTAMQQWIAAPLAVGATAGAALAFFQGTVNIGFLSGGVWPSMGRAAGSLLDANSFGMVVALWSAGLLAFTGSKRLRLAGVAAAALCWAAIWMTGSRTALLAGFIALVPVGLALLRINRSRIGRRELLIGGGILAAMLVVLLLSPAKGPLDRLRHMPTFAGDEDMGWLVREFWDRSSYGGAAAAMIGQHPASGIGLGMFHMMGADYIRIHLHHVPPDNAQNWWRHNIVELGFLGALGLIVWSGLFLVYLLRTSGSGDRTLPAAALKGALVAIGLASMMGMPAQSLPVVITFWTFAAWYTRLVEREAAAPAVGLRPAVWAAVLAVVCAFLGSTIWAAERGLRPPLRAAADNRPYTYGMYEVPGPAPEGASVLWTEGRGVAAVPIDGPIMLLSVRADHPDLPARPVKAVVKVNGQVAVEATLHTNVPITKRIDVGAGPRALIEAHVDRTWRSDTDPPGRERGLVLTWRFVLNNSESGGFSAALRRDDRVIQVREEPLVQAVHVRIECLHDVLERRREAVDARVLQPSGFGDRGSEMYVGALEPGRDDEELERVGMEWPDVRDVADITLEERDPA
jgi:hypothetical protein